MSKPDSTVLSEADQQAIRATALDYMQGWYEGDAARMDSSLHEILAKRSVTVNEETKLEQLWNLSKAEMVEYTAGGGGKDAPRDELVYDVTILDSFKEVVTIKVAAYDFVDFLHLAKLNGAWKIVNAIWAHR